MLYPTLKMKIPKYNWEIEYYEMTELESELLQKAVNEDDNETILKVATGLIRSWNCTDRAGNVLKVNTDGVRHLPVQVIQQIILGAKNGNGSFLDDPKVKSSSSQHIQDAPVTGGIKQEKIQD